MHEEIYDESSGGKFAYLYPDEATTFAIQSRNKGQTNKYTVAIFVNLLDSNP